MEWTRQFFDKTWIEHGFNLVSADQTHKEVEFIEAALRLRPKEKLLDLCCGIGRHSIGLAAKGYAVTGIDANPDYVRHAQSAALTLRERPTFLETDMRKLPFVNMFDTAICMWSSFGLFDEETDLNVLRGLAKAMKRGGRFLLDVPNRDYVLRHYRERDWAKADRYYAMEKHVFHCDTSRLVTTWLFAAAEGRIIRKVSELRLYGLYDLEVLFKKAGYRILSRYGDLEKARPSLETPRLLIVATT